MNHARSEFLSVYTLDGTILTALCPIPQFLRQEFIDALMDAKLVALAASFQAHWKKT